MNRAVFSFGHGITLSVLGVNKSGLALGWVAWIKMRSSAVSLTSVPILDPKLLVVAASVLVLLLFLLRYRRRAATPFAVALVVATFWSTYIRYEYNGSNVFLWDRINVYPLILWTIGLTVTYLGSLALPKKYRFAYAIIIYLILLLAAEAIGYHLLAIRLESNYTSLLGLGVVHAPVSMKIFYVLAGPIYLVFVEWLTRKLPAAQ